MLFTNPIIYAIQSLILKVFLYTFSDPREVVDRAQYLGS